MIKRTQHQQDIKVQGDVRAFDISDLANGVYFVTIYTQNALPSVKKIIKIQ